MTPEYLHELADLADPKQLWRLSGIEKMSLSPEDRQQLDMGVALRRYARDVQSLRLLLGTGQSLLITPLGPISRAVKAIPTPDDHKHLLRG